MKLQNASNLQAACAETETANKKVASLADANEKLTEEVANLRKEFEKEIADRDFALNHAKDTILGLEKEVEDLQDAVQQDINKEHLERVRLANQPKPSEEAAENYRLDRDDSIAPSGPKGNAGTNNEPLLHL